MQAERAEVPATVASTGAVIFAVLAFRSEAETAAKWQPLVDHLNAAIPERSFVLEALTYPELEQAVADRRVDIVLTQPSHYSLLTYRDGLLSPLATLVERDGAHKLAQFGGVILVLAERDDIQTIEDLRGQRIATSSIGSLGSYQMQALELRRRGVRLPGDAHVIETGQPQDKAIEAVLSREADVAFVRTGVLEAMIREGKLGASQMKVINAAEAGVYPYVLSTPLYPEWPLAVMPWMDEEVARRLAAAVLGLQHDGEVARMIGITGFTIPMDYQPVATLLRELRLPPYDDVPEFTLADVWAQYQWPIIGVAATLTVLSLLLMVRRQRRLQQAMQMAESALARLREAEEVVGMGHWVIELGTNRLEWSEQTCRMFGIDPNTPANAELFMQVTHPDDRVSLSSAWEAAVRSCGVCEIDHRIVVHGEVRWVRERADVSRARKGKVVGTVLDITARRQAEEDLRLAASVFTHAREGIVITDSEVNIVDVNRAFTNITGYTKEEVLGKNPRILNSGRQDEAFYAAMWQDLRTKGHWYGELWNRRKLGEVYPESLTISAVRDERGETRNYIALFSDITLIKEQQRLLKHIAHYDALTNLPNRLLLADRLQQAMSQARRRGNLLAVVYLDLDGFKAVNDSFDHKVGDQLLVALGRSMSDALREGDTLARLGGDEFVAVLVDLPDAESAFPVLQRLLGAAAQPVPVGELSLQVSASIGVSFWPQTDAVDPDQLIRQADQAMYQAKQAGRNRYHLFDAEHDRDVRARHESLARIRQALEDREFVLYYQPKVDMRTGALLGAEALIRWQHPERGLLTPAMFLPVIENHALSIEVGEWVMETALAQIEAWHAIGRTIPVSVNVNALQLQQADFVSRLRDALARYPEVKPDELSLEVLETSALADFAHITEVMRACQTMGVGVAVDDFGTGYSALAYLKQLPAAMLKIDQSFVRDMLEDPDDLAILEGVIGLAAAFRRHVIAEGVETPAHGEMLLRLGCFWGQGYAIARPMPAQDLLHWAGEWKVPVSWQTSKPVTRDRLPVLYATVDHRAWIQAMVSYLEGFSETPPVSDEHECRFGIWLDRGGLDWLPDANALFAINSLHHEVHRLGVELVQLKQAGQTEQVKARLSELLCLRDQLLDRLSGLY